MHVGLIGGIGIGATEFYYRRLVREFAERGRALQLTIAHADLATELDNLMRDDRAAQAAIFAQLTRQLAAAGAGCVAIPSVAGHFCIAEFEAISPIPPVNLLDAVAAHVASRGARRVGLLGTRTVMASRFYDSLPSVEVVPPGGPDLDEVHGAYLDVALAGTADARQREVFSDVGRRLVSGRGCEAIILGGTDLSLVYGTEPPPFPVVDCAAIHVDAIVELAA